jgi:hypothetical protein
MKKIQLFILQTVTCFFWSCNYENRIYDIVPKGSVLNSTVLQNCNQILITDNNLILMYYIYSASDAYNPFSMEPFILFYNNKLELQSIKWVNSVKIKQIKNDTIFLHERSGIHNDGIRQTLILPYHIKYLPNTHHKTSIYNKVIESFTLDSITFKVRVKIRKYEDLYIGLRNPEFFKDTKIPYLKKEMICNVSDFIFNQTEHLGDKTSIKKVTLRYNANNQEIVDILYFENAKILQKFYDNLYNLISTKWQCSKVIDNKKYPRSS